MKTKYSSRHTVVSGLRVCLSEIDPRIDSLCGKKQPFSVALMSVFYDKTFSNVIYFALALSFRAVWVEKFTRHKTGVREKQIHKWKSVA